MNGVAGITGRIAPTTAKPRASSPAPRRAIRLVPVAGGIRWSIYYLPTPNVPRSVPVRPAGKEKGPPSPEGPAGPG